MTRLRSVVTMRARFPVLCQCLTASRNRASAGSGGSWRLRSATVAVRAVPATYRLPTSWARCRASSRAAAAPVGSRSASASPSANRAIAMAVGLAEARTPTVARWATAAGFTGFEVLPVDNSFWRFYRMHG
jgi:hypothetical protein